MLCLLTQGATGAAGSYRQRVLQLGSRPDRKRVFLAGAPWLQRAPDPRRSLRVTAHHHFLSSCETPCQLAPLGDIPLLCETHLPDEVCNGAQDLRHEASRRATRDRDQSGLCGCGAGGNPNHQDREARARPESRPRQDARNGEPLRRPLSTGSCAVSYQAVAVVYAARLPPLRDKGMLRPYVEKAVLARLAEFAGTDGGSIRPSHARLAADLEMSERTVRAAIRQLVGRGVLRQTQPASPRTGRAAEYAIDLSRLEA